MAKLFVFLLSLTAVFFFFIPTLSATSPVSGKIIVLDPGHGGDDFGSTQCSGLPEKLVTLDIAQKLNALLSTDGAQVVMTRADDQTLTNSDRYTIANNAGGQVLVSIHLNGSTNLTKDGTQGLYGKLIKDLAFTKTIHSRLASELGVADLQVTNFASGVLLKSNMPATIQETVFISNADECNLLKTAGGVRQQQIANSLYNGLLDWFSNPQPSPKPGKNR